MSGPWRVLLLGLISLPALLLLAWLASNGVDNAARPVPEALALGPNPPGSPLFYAIQGMLAPAGATPEATGRREWQHAASTGRAPADAVTVSKPIQGLPLDCRAPQDCAQLLARSTTQLATQLGPATLLAERCSAAMAGDLRFEEHLPARMHAASPLPSYIGGVQCALWFSGQAVLAASRADLATTQHQLQQGRRLADAMLAGCRMLICKMVAVRMMEAQLDGMAAVALLRPAWAAELIRLLPPLPAQALTATEWLKTEHAQMRGGLDDLMAECGSGLAALVLGSTSQLLDRASQLACKWHIGLLPNATREALDQRWLRTWTLANQGLDTALDESITQRRAGPVAPAGLAWRNTLGAKLAGLLEGASYDEYFARQADVELRRIALLTALGAQAQQVPLVERPAWLGRQDLAQRQRSRIAWVDGGAALQVRPWLADINSGNQRAAVYRLAVAAP